MFDLTSVLLDLIPVYYVDDMEFYVIYVDANFTLDCFINQGLCNSHFPPLLCC